MVQLPEIVRVTTDEQLEQVSRLFRSYQSWLPDTYRFPDEEWQELPGAYGPPTGGLLLATVSGQPAGCVGLRPFSKSTCEMKRLHVYPEFRGQNIGWLLINKIIELGREIGYLSMRLDTHPPTMGAAVALYRRIGFTEVPAAPLPPTKGLVYMKLPLA